MANQQPDSPMDNSQFWHSYASSSKGPDSDHYDRLEDEWQFTAPKGKDSKERGAQANSYQESQLARLQSELDSVTELLEDTALSLGFFGLSSREIHEWQYDNPETANAKQKLVDDSQTEQLCPELEVSSLRAELAKWLPAT
ncbi:MAG TPA: hypothetical protein V6C97_34675 [Oculatellaceae cyanobacterium]